MRRQLRPFLPRLAAVYGLTWPDLETMPRGELHEYLLHLGDRGT